MSGLCLNWFVGILSGYLDISGWGVRGFSGWMGFLYRFDDILGCDLIGLVY